MWALFTKALARGHSTTQVSIMNTSSNFVITAILGFVIFSEALPPLWWLGAAMLVAGNVIIGRKDEGSAPEASGIDDASSEAPLEGELETYQDAAALDGFPSVIKQDDDILDLGLEDTQQESSR